MRENYSNGKIKKIVAKSCQELSKENFILKKIWEKIENFPSFYNSLRHRRRVITTSLLMNLLKQFHSIYFLCQRECCDLDVCLFACVINKSSETQECINKNKVVCSLLSHSASAIKIHWTCIKSHRCNPFEFSIEPWKRLPYGTKKLVNFIITKFIRFFLISTFESKTFFFVLCDDKNNLSVRDKLRFYISLFLLGCWLQSIWIFINRWAVCRKNMNVWLVGWWWKVHMF